MTETKPRILSERIRLDDERLSVTHRFAIMSPDGERKFYVTCGYYPNGRIGEVFITEGKEGSTSHGYLDALATAISIGLQYGVPLEAYTSKMMNSQFEPAGPLRFSAPTKIRDITGNILRFAKSPLDYLARYLERRFPGGYRKTEEQYHTEHLASLEASGPTGTEEERAGENK